MNLSEAMAVSRVLRWLIGDREVTVEQARALAAWLADRAHSAMGDGITAEQLNQRWLRPTAPAPDPQMSPARLAEIVTQSEAASSGVAELVEEVQRAHGVACALAIDRDRLLTEVREANERLIEAQREHMEWLSLAEVRTYDDVIEKRNGDGGEHP